MRIARESQIGRLQFITRMHERQRPLFTAAAIDNRDPYMVGRGLGQPRPSSGRRLTDPDDMEPEVRAFFGDKLQGCATPGECAEFQAANDLVVKRKALGLPIDIGKNIIVSVRSVRDAATLQALSPVNPCLSCDTYLGRFVTLLRAW